jgi:serine/threonine protein kinase
MENEARVLEKFHENGGHENIVTVLGYGWLDPRKERFYVDLEPCIMNLDDYVKGDIKSILGLPRYFDPLLHERSLRCLSFWGIMNDIASGLNFMHSSHELHRDVKPRNGTLSHFSKSDDF